MESKKGSCRKFYWLITKTVKSNIFFHDIKVLFIIYMRHPYWGDTPLKCVVFLRFF
jgi:hypothetical protein